jgi:ribose 5-phosphate isomerase B
LAPAERDAADDAMVARAHERFAVERRRVRGRLRRRGGALPNLVVIGGLKCGTTSIHHYLNLHPQIEMSRPKELNFFVAELNWPLGPGWYASHFSGRSSVRGESSPHYTNRPRFEGVAERMRSLLGDARVVYVVRDPIDRMLSHYLHNLGGGYDDRSLADALADPESAYVARSRYFFQLEPYLEEFGRERIEIVSREELKRDRSATMRRLFEFLGVDAGFSSKHFEREWETGTAKGGGRFRVMDRAVRLPGLRTVDRNFDRLPEALRWLVERVIHDPGAGEAPKPEVPRTLSAELTDLFRDDVARLEQVAGRPFGWLGYTEASEAVCMRVAVAADERVGIAEAIVDELRRRGHEPIPHGALSDTERDDWAWASEAASRDVAEGRSEQAIVCCWTGTGASIAANKVPGVRAALCGDAQTAAGARRWNDANVLALSLRATSEAELGEILDAWFESTPSSEADDRANVAHLSEIESPT